MEEVCVRHHHIAISVTAVCEGLKYLLWGTKESYFVLICASDSVLPRSFLTLTALLHLYKAQSNRGTY